MPKLCGARDFMKLLKPESCSWEFGRGNVKTRTALGEAVPVRSSDRGSTPLGSTIQKRPQAIVCRRFLFAKSLIYKAFSILFNGNRLCECSEASTAEPVFIFVGKPFNYGKIKRLKVLGDFSYLYYLDVAHNRKFLFIDFAALMTKVIQNGIFPKK